MKVLMRGEISQIIKANREDVYNSAAYENIPRWSKAFKSLKVVSKEGNTVKAEVEVRILCIKLKAMVTGIWRPYEEVVEEIVIDDGTITKERVRFTEVPKGTRVDWTGEVVRLGRWTKIFGPLMKWAFQKSVKKMFEDLRKYMESGKYKEGQKKNLPPSQQNNIFINTTNNMTNQTINKFVSDEIKSTGCCEPFNPAPWQEKEITWKDKIFVKDHVTSFFHIPLDMGKKIIRNMELIEKAEAKAPHQMIMTDEKSLWGADIYIDVLKEVPGAQMTTISGTFLTRVFEGPYQNVGKWANEMKEYLKSKGKELKKLYFSYTTCPKCAKVYGKNYVVLFAQIN